VHVQEPGGTGSTAGAAVPVGAAALHERRRLDGGADAPAPTAPQGTAAGGNAPLDRLAGTEALGLSADDRFELFMHDVLPRLRCLLAPVLPGAEAGELAPPPAGMYV
jgi:hypothetical protein